MAFSAPSPDDALFYDFLDLPQPYLDTQPVLQPAYSANSPLSSSALSPLSTDFAHSLAPSLCSPTSADGFPSYYAAPSDPEPANFEDVLKQFGLDFLPASQLDREPLVVNAKQYHRILKRRATRAQQAAAQRRELGGKASRFVLVLLCTDLLQTYKHESRHKHAVARPRGPGGVSRLLFSSCRF
jgi:hypothetical protein